MAEPARGPGADPIEVVPVVVLSQIFPARPSSIPDIRDFVRRCLAESPLTEEGAREVGETVFRALLDAAGPTGYIQVAFRIFPEHVEVDVLHSAMQIPAQLVRSIDPAISAAPPAPAAPARPVPGSQAARAAAAAADGEPGAGDPGRPEGPAGPPAEADGFPPADPATFAEWMSRTLRREGLTQEAAARQLGVSVKTVSRWVGGATEPRMRDLRRIQEVFGETPLR
ncbi:MAG TPA: helix-turn-helix transcriptional regulator [Streptosporangiaceae bacterium]|nr:helix-turn-helix transcriptional regulator [Streptosporangiaceae bacterium]